MTHGLTLAPNFFVYQLWFSFWTGILLIRSISIHSRLLARQYPRYFEFEYEYGCSQTKALAEETASLPASYRGKIHLILSETNIQPRVDVSATLSRPGQDHDDAVSLIFGS